MGVELVGLDQVGQMSKGAHVVYFASNPDTVHHVSVHLRLRGPTFNMVMESGSQQIKL